MLRQSKILYGGLRALDRELGTPRWQEARYTILVDENTFRHCLPLLIGGVEALQEADFIEVPVGEECKSLEVAAQVWQTLLEGGADRQSVVVNLGGGCVCDLGGFVAAIKFDVLSTEDNAIYGMTGGQMAPTTLLGMTDAAIGGKTAVDFGGVKNSIGHFYPAALTVLEPAFLETLPQEELTNGLMEMVKTAAVTDPTLFVQLLSTTHYPLPTIKQVARIKARVVKADPYDQGVRKILNFGHTFGHAIEVYRGLPHGMAVGIGMKAAMYLSVRKLGLAEEAYASYSRWLTSQPFTSHLSPFTLKDIEAMLPLMHQDKKNTDGRLRCVLLQEPGAAVIDVEISDNEVRDTLLTISK